MKCCLAVVLFALGFLATGERSIYHLANFEQTYWGITFEYDLYGDKDTEYLAKDELEAALRESNFDVFYVETVYESEYETVKMIYGTENALAELEKSGIRPGVYHSVFLGDVQVVFKDFSEISNIYESDQFYFTGTLLDAARFKNISVSELTQYYHVKDINEKNGTTKGLYATILLVWGVVFSLALLMSYYETLVNKKKLVIEATMGKSPDYAFRVNAASDNGLCILIFAGEAALFSRIYYVFMFPFICLLFALFLAINTAIYWMGSRISVRRDLALLSGGRWLILCTQTMKGLITLAVTALVLANSVIVVTLGEYNRQEELFQSMSDLDYCVIRDNGSLAGQPEKIRDWYYHIWYEFDRTFSQNAIRAVDMTVSYGYSTVVLNENAIDHVFLRCDSELATQLRACGENHVYMFYPSKCRSEVVDSAAQMAKSIFLNGDSLDADAADEALVISSYTGSTDVLAIDINSKLYGSDILREPIIILDMMERTESSWYPNAMRITEDTLYPMEDGALRQFAADHGLGERNFTFTNVYERYKHYQGIMERNAKAMIGISVLLFIIEFFSIVFTIQLIYVSSGVEFAVKTVLGYSRFSRAPSVYLTPLVVIPLCVLAGAVITRITNYGSPVSVILWGAVLLVLELAVSGRKLKKMEQIGLNAVIKGAL